MPKFRHRPSQRKAPKPIASWLILGPTETSAVKHDHRTTALIPCKPSHHLRRYHEGQTLAVKAYVGGPTECKVTVTVAERIQLGDIDYQTARSLGYVRVDQFQVTWVEQNDQAWTAKLQEDEPDNVIERFSRKLDRFGSRHAHKLVWLLAFKLDRLQPLRLLAAHSEELYTDSPARALRDEPPALYEDEWKRHIEANLDLEHGQWIALSRLISLGEKSKAHTVRGRNMRKKAA